ncbi:MAG: H/ACA RNA-protein complex protein Gar1 [Candidatus Bathyarchaeota archaeon]|nr:MAG: H/ACA RNA-protein complex protein Gar1 [Candidatus Bathyarchaeota archaeon]
MKRLGCVLHISPSRNLILKADTLPKIGDKVIDGDLKSVGSVFDIIGPVPAPYIVVKSVTPEPQSLVNNMLFTIPSNMQRREKGKSER